MNELWRDIRYGLRLLWKSPGFTSVSLLALALGIGATTAIFSLLYSVLLAPLPYVDSDQAVVMVWSHDKSGGNANPIPQRPPRLAKQATVFGSSTAGPAKASPIPTPDWTGTVRASRRSPRLVRPSSSAPRSLSAAISLPTTPCPGNDHVVILNNKFWRDHSRRANPSVVGRALRMSGDLYTVLGVAASQPL